MPMDPRRQAALLLGAGGAGAASMLGLALADVYGVGSPQARAGILLFALLVTAALAIGLAAAFRAPADPNRRALAALGAMLWLTGLGADLYDPSAVQAKLLAAHAAAAVGGAALAATGALLLRAARGPRPS